MGGCLVDVSLEEEDDTLVEAPLGVQKHQLLLHVLGRPALQHLVLRLGFRVQGSGFRV